MIKDKLEKILPFTLDFKSLVLGLILFGSIGWLYFEVLGLRAELTQLNIKLELLTREPPTQIAEPAPSLQPPAPPAPSVAAEVSKPSPKVSSSNWKSELIKHLKEINGGREPKRVIYQKGAVVILDATLANEDPFFEMLGNLMDEDRLIRIDVPRKIYETPLPKGLITYGVPPSAIRSASVQSIRVVVSESD